MEAQKVEGTGYLMRASSQNRVRSIVTISLLLASFSLLGALAISSSSSALLDLKTPLISSEPKTPNIIKRVTSRVPIVSSLLDKASEPTKTPAPETPSSQPTRSPSSQQVDSTPSKGESKKATDAQNESQPGSAPAITQQQPNDLNTLQFVSAPYYGGDGRLASAPAAQAAATFAVLEPSAEGWRVFGLAWYWWLGLVASLLSVALWRDKLLQFALFGRQKWQFLLSSKR